MRENWPAWTQVIVAAFGINLLALAVPLFVMNVYDRVIPNAAVVTLWTLAIGVGIALLLDLALRTLRMSVLEIHRAAHRPARSEAASSIRRSPRA